MLGEYSKALDEFNYLLYATLAIADGEKVCVSSSVRIYNKIFYRHLLKLLKLHYLIENKKCYSIGQFPSSIATMTSMQQ